MKGPSDIIVVVWHWTQARGMSPGVSDAWSGPEMPGHGLGPCFKKYGPSIFFFFLVYLPFFLSSLALEIMLNICSLEFRSVLDSLRCLGIANVLSSKKKI
jgi:hypothetical protein